jgi:hypothetical protein
VNETPPNSAASQDVSSRQQVQTVIWREVILFEEQQEGQKKC